jgi:hypothetical protein
MLFLYSTPLIQLTQSVVSSESEEVHRRTKLEPTRGQPSTLPSIDTVYLLSGRHFELSQYKTRGVPTETTAITFQPVDVVDAVYP